MAVAPSATTVPETHNFSISLITFLLFIFLISSLHVNHIRPMALMMPAASSPSISLASRRLLSESSMTSFHPKLTQNHHHHPSHSSSSTTPSSRREIEAGAHEVPSGPNPISNR
ncbi:hypothetical protein SAY86_002797 [Trapa natans]|uniref:Uncharacterized protein n=1 Tax=Trapa natans TaxID=22666 RepID=A0AAN7R537_TRANT|nr:hypothetical protein SAY86_002797 [Trapa natans]